MIPTTRGTGRLAAAMAAIALAALVAACASSGAARGTAAGALASPGASGNVPAVLAGASSTPVTRLTLGGAALSLQEQMVAVIKAVSPSVVEIQTDAGLGSGVVYDGRGDIVTNAHVVGTSTTFGVTASDGKTYKATLVGFYTPDDIAVIRVSGASLSPANFGDSSQLSVGDFVLAMGNPLGLQSSVTEGIVSAIGRQVSEPGGNALPDAIQTTAAINPGNSGGALVDLVGEVVGIPTLEAVDPQIGGSAPGIGFAISSNRAKFIADQLIAQGKVVDSGRAYLGVQLADGVNGPIVVSVSPGGPADGAGLVAGDTGVSIDGEATPDGATLIEAVAAHKPGDTVKLDIQRQDGTSATLSLTLGELPG